MILILSDALQIITTFDTWNYLIIRPFKIGYCQRIDPSLAFFFGIDTEKKQFLFLHWRLLVKQNEEYILRWSATTPTCERTVSKRSPKVQASLALSVATSCTCFITLELSLMSRLRPRWVTTMSLFADPDTSSLNSWAYRFTLHRCKKLDIICLCETIYEAKNWD